MKKSPIVLAILMLFVTTAINGNLNDDDAIDDEKNSELHELLPEYLNYTLYVKHSENSASFKDSPQRILIAVTTASVASVFIGRALF